MPTLTLTDNTCEAPVQTTPARLAPAITMLPATPIDMASEGWYSIGESVYPPRYSLTQTGNAERLLARFGDHLKYCHTWGRWLQWAGSRWVRDEKEEIWSLALQTVRAIKQEATRTSNSTSESEETAKIRKSLLDHAKRSERRSELDSMIHIAARMPSVGVTAGELDSNPYLFNCANGTIDLLSGKIRKHSERDLLTKISPVAYEPEAECPRWEQFLREVFAGDEELITFTQRMLGCTLTGETEKALFFLEGKGDNGKTTLLEVFRHIMGDYAQLTRIGLLMAKSVNNEQRYALANLQGARFVTASETQEGEQLNESIVKQLAGQQTLEGRHPYGKLFQFYPQFKLFLDANHKPRIQGTDHAIWSRLRLLPFKVRFSSVAGELAPPYVMPKDPRLKLALAAEAPGILAWAVQGCLAWQRDGLPTPAAMRKATSEYKSEMDIVETFIEECCERDVAAEFKPSEMHIAYTKWCKDRGEKPLYINLFSPRLEEKGYTIQPNRKRSGLRLKAGYRAMYF
jgi:putative DNA primase/helicase